MTLTKVHKGAKFKQRYVETDEKCYGKTNENVSNHIDFGLLATQNKIPKCINNSNYTGCHIINEELSGVEKLLLYFELSPP